MCTQQLISQIRKDWGYKVWKLKKWRSCFLSAVLLWGNVLLELLFDGFSFSFFFFFWLGLNTQICISYICIFELHVVLYTNNWLDKFLTFQLLCFQQCISNIEGNLIGEEKKKRKVFKKGEWAIIWLTQIAHDRVPLKINASMRVQ